MQLETKRLGGTPIEAGPMTPDQPQDPLRYPRIAGPRGALATGALQTAILNSASFSIIATDEEGIIQLFNVGAERMLGYLAADVMGKITPAEISDPQEITTRAKALSFELGTTITPGLEALVFKASRGIEDIYELTYIRKDGSRFPAVVSVTALREAKGGIIGYLLIGTDNTARKQIEAEQKILDQRLRDQQFYTRSLIESSIDAIMTTDSQGIITDVNQQMGTLTGCTRDELIGAPFKNYFTDPERAEASIKQVLTEGRVTNYELTARARGGKETVVSYNAIILYDRDRRLQGVFAAARDVTELKRFEQTLQESNAQLRKLEELRDNLVHMVVHDMRTPLTAIYGFLRTLETLEGESLSDQGREFVQTALASTEDLVEMVSSLLDVSKMEAGEMKLNLTQCDLLTTAREALVKVEPLRGDRQLMLSGAEEPVTVMADAELIARVFQNLLGNALKFTPEDGRVTVSIESGAEAARVLVQDTGPGIPPEYRGRIFEKFGQVENSANRQRHSTGIGLTFCKLAVEAHGGQIGVDSEEGRGSTFWFTLPRGECAS
jgi:PAS domain S-box-containing protein